MKVYMFISIFRQPDTTYEVEVSLATNFVADVYQQWHDFSDDEALQFLRKNWEEP